MNSYITMQELTDALLRFPDEFLEENRNKLKSEDANIQKELLENVSE